MKVGAVFDDTGPISGIEAVFHAIDQSNVINLCVPCNLTS